MGGGVPGVALSLGGVAGPRCDRVHRECGGQRGRGVARRLQGPARMTGGLRSARRVEGVIRRGWCARLWVGRQVSAGGRVRGSGDRLRFFLFLGERGRRCRGRGDLFVVEPGGCFASLMSELLFAVIGAGWELAEM
jgi:hypothetical protein